jgi:hypothetical protein
MLVLKFWSRRLWVINPCTQQKSHMFQSNVLFQFSGSQIIHARNQHTKKESYKDDMFLWNVRLFIIYTALCHKKPFTLLYVYWLSNDRLCGLVVRVPDYRSRSPGSIPGATRFSEKWCDWNEVRSVSWVQLRSHLKGKVAAPVYKTEITAVGYLPLWLCDAPLSAKFGTNFADKTVARSVQFVRGLKPRS